MGFDYAFFALLFAVATTLAPADAREVTLVNGAHPDETLVWTRGEDARWALTVNGRDVGHFRRDGAMVVHETGQRAPDRFPIASLVDPDSLRRGATRLPTKGGSRRSRPRTPAWPASPSRGGGDSARPRSSRRRGSAPPRDGGPPRWGAPGPGDAPARTAAPPAARPPGAWGGRTPPPARARSARSPAPARARRADPSRARTRRPGPGPGRARRGRTRGDPPSHIPAGTEPSATGALRHPDGTVARRNP